MNINKWILKNDRKFAFCFALLLTILIFSPFARILSYEGHIPFAKGGDLFQQTYPNFRHIGYMLHHGIVLGTDITAGNGASDIVIMVQHLYYLPTMIFALIAEFLPNSLPHVDELRHAIYASLFAIHLFAALYFAQRVASVFFKAKKRISVLLACSCLTCWLFNAWFDGLFFESTLLFPLLYFSLSFVNKKVPVSHYFILPLLLIGLITGGYLNATLLCIPLVYIITLLYFWHESMITRHTVIRLTVVYAVAGIIIFANMLQSYVYFTRYVSDFGMRNIATAFDRQWDIRDVFSILFLTNSIQPMANGLGDQQLYGIGLIWIIAILLIIKYKILSTEFNNKNKILFCALVIPALLIFLVQIGTNLPFAAWFFSLMPIVGQTHLWVRQLTTLLPLFFLGMCFALSKLPVDVVLKKNAKKISITLLAVGALPLLLSRFIVIKTINTQQLFLICTMFALIIWLASVRTFTSKTVIAVWCVSLAIFPLVNFYSGIYGKKSNFSNFSIVFQEGTVKKIDEFVKSNSEKYINKFGYANPDEDRNWYVPINLAKYHLNDVRLDNYYSYARHMTMSEEYMVTMRDYGVFPIKYMACSRADYFITKEKWLENNGTLANMLTGNKISLGSEVFMYSFKKYIPMRYTDGEFIEDRPDVLDNGIFYAKDLNQDDLLAFDSDEASWFTATIHADKATEISFLLYPNSHWHYYIDNVEVYPEKQDLCAYFSIPAGTHNIRLEYKSITNTISNFMIFGYYGLCVMLAFGRGCVAFYKFTQMRVRKRGAV
jgi:hypothetical protein